MASLLTVTGDRLELKQGQSYVLGRGPDCDFVLHDGACSRRHARISLGRTDEAITLRDLGSRNGTYVDDRRIKGVVSLRNLNRIRVGSTLYLLSLVDAGTQPSPDRDGGADPFEMTIGFDRPRSRAAPRASDESKAQDPGFAGQIGVFHVFDVLAFLVNSRRSGALHLAFEGGQGRVDVRDGEVWGASCGDLEGPEALDALVRRQAGLFWLLDDRGPCPRTIEVPSSQLLVHLFVALDRSAPA